MIVFLFRDVLKQGIGQACLSLSQIHYFRVLPEEHGQRSFVLVNFHLLGVLNYVKQYNAPTDFLCSCWLKCIT